MAIEIRYETVVNRCKLLSSYEAQASADKAGDTLYMSIKMTEKENGFIIAHLKEASRMIESRLNSSLDLTIDTDDGITEGVGGITAMTIADMESVNNKGKIIVSVSEDYDMDMKLTRRGSFAKSLAETMVAWIMGQWLMEKVQQRGEAYMRMYEQMLDATRVIALKRDRPTYKA